MTNHTPTDEQQAVIDQARASESLMIQAFAGCAKSTTIEMMAKRVNVPSLALAFNKRIADELRPRLPGTFEVKTLNGLGHQAWSRALRGSVTNCTLDDRKIGKLVGEISERQGAKLSTVQWEQARQLVSGAMQAGITPGDQGEPIASDCEASWRDAAIDQGIGADDFPLAWGIAREVLVESVARARAGLICFDDQIYCPTLLGGAWPRFPLVAVDESQDLSALNHKMLELVTRDRLVAVGDQRQGIYAWRGADAESMRNLRKLRPEESWIDLPLQTTFRCPKVIVARQQKHAPGFRAAESCREGSFEQAPRYDEDEAAGGNIDAWGWSWEWLERTAAGGSIAVICRNNAPLLSLAFKLIRQGIGPAMPGRELGKGLTGLMRKLSAADCPIGVLLGKLEAWEAREIGNLLASEREDRVESVQDRAECIRAVCEASEARTRDELIAAVEQVFARASGKLTLLSGHKSKGLEWDCVLHLDPWRVPSKQSRERARLGDRRGLEQEMNLLYVVETRTRDKLVNARLEDFR